MSSPLLHLASTNVVTVSGKKVRKSTPKAATTTKATTQKTLTTAKERLKPTPSPVKTTQKNAKSGHGDGDNGISAPSPSSTLKPTSASSPAQAPAIVIDNQQQVPATQQVCDGRCLAERRIHCRELGKLGRQALMLVGLENVFQRAIGPIQWRRYSRAVKVSISNPTDFRCADSAASSSSVIDDEEQRQTSTLCCNWCLGQREGATGHELCPTMNPTLLNGSGFLFGAANNGEAVNGNGNSNLSNSASSAGPSSTGSSTASSPTGNSGAPPAASINKLLLPSLLFGGGAGNSMLHSANNNRGEHKQPTISSSASSGAPSKVQKPASSTTAAAASALDPFARLQNNATAGANVSNNGHQQQNPLPGAASAAERLAMTAAAMQFMQQMAAAAALVNGTSAGRNGSGSPPNAAAAALFPSLFTQTAGLYPYWPFSPMALAMQQHFPNFAALQHLGAAANPFAQQQNGSTNSNARTNPSSPTTPPAGGVDLHQQLALAWHSQLLALGLMSSLNGGALNPFGSSMAPQPPPTTTTNGGSGSREQQHLASSEDEALALLFGRKKGNSKNAPLDEGGNNDGGGRVKQELLPLDLSSPAKSSPSGKKQSPANGNAKKTATKRSYGTKPEPIAQQVLVKNESTGSLQALDEEEFDQLEELGPDGNLLLEDGSEAESPKLGTKKSYSQADLDAAVLDIRQGKLGTRRASVVYGIPRSTLRNKIYKLEATEDGTDGVAPKRRRLLCTPNRQRPSTTPKKDVLNQSGLIKVEEEEEEEMEEEQPEQKYGANADIAADQRGSSAASPLEAQQNASSPLSSLPSSLAMSAQKLLKEFSGQIGHFFVGPYQPQQQQQEQPKKKGPKSGEKLLLTNGSLQMLVNKHEQEPESPQSAGVVESGNQTAAAAKVQRPKRGQYRKYDKDALDKAVAAVRRGEMSVHRAGSHFGVPHSTLEYKVKERNLLRTKSKKQLLSFHSVASMMSVSSNDINADGNINTTIGAKVEPLEPLANDDSKEPLTPVTGEVHTMLGTMLDTVAAAYLAEKN